MSQNISREQSSSPLLLERDNSHHESCGKLENSEDKAEASASAAAVTAISKDKTAVNGLSCVSNADAKNIGSADVHGIGGHTFFRFKNV